MTSDQDIKTFYYCGQFRVGERVTKVKGSSWTGKIVGVYTSSLTQSGYCVESEKEPGSVQLYPEAALQSAPLLDALDDTRNPNELRRQRGW